jgi:general secretion pathway protein B
MSILLDALKKSEAQRQLGSTPTLETTLDGGELISERGRSWVPISMMLVSAAIICWVYWVQFQPPEAGEMLADSSPQVNQEQTGSGPLNAAENALQQPQAKTPMMDFESSDALPDSAGTKQPSAASPGEEDRASTPASVRTYSAAKKPPGADQTSRLSEARLRNRARKARENRDNVRRVNPQPEETQPARAKAKTTPADRSAESEPAVIFDNQSISYWQVPQSVRDSMPELRITVLVYAEHPEDRFLLSNGERWRESDEIGGGLVLEEIQRGRAIFSYRNYIFHLKG